jgi:hypothetical protein
MQAETVYAVPKHKMQAETRRSSKGQVMGANTRPNHPEQFLYRDTHVDCLSKQIALIFGLSLVIEVRGKQAAMRRSPASAAPEGFANTNAIAMARLPYSTAIWTPESSFLTWLHKLT